MTGFVISGRMSKFRICDIREIEFTPDLLYPVIEHIPDLLYSVIEHIPDLLYPVN